MATGINILLLGTGTAGARAAYYLYQRGSLPGLQIVAVDSDADSLAQLPTLANVKVPPPPTLPIGAVAENARKALAEPLDEHSAAVKLLVVLTFLGGSTSGFYTQAALQYAKLHNLPAVALAAMPHAFDSEECRQHAATTLNVLRAEHFEILTLECAMLGGLFPDTAKESAYPQAVRWVAETALGYLRLFTQPQLFPHLENGNGSTAKVLNFAEMPSGIFASTFPTFFNDQNLDIPTFLRKNLTLPIPNNSPNSNPNDHASN